MRKWNFVDHRTETWGRAWRFLQISIHMRSQLLRRTFEVNHISKDQFEVYQGNVLDDKEFAASLGSKCYPVVVANILADVISPLIEIVDQFLAEDWCFCNLWYHSHGYWTQTAVLYK